MKSFMKVRMHYPPNQRYLMHVDCSNLFLIILFVPYFDANAILIILSKYSTSWHKIGNGNIHITLLNILGLFMDPEVNVA